MINVGAFCEWVSTELNTTALIPSDAPRKEFPYITVVSIVTNHPRTHQVGKEQIDADTVRTTFQEREQLSLTAIGSSQTNASKDLCFALRDLLYSQGRKDFFAENGWKFRMVSFPMARYLSVDDAGEERHGFDIEISKIYTINETTAGSIEQVTITDEGGKIDTVTVDAET